jgi:uncharacterized membrane protein (UPF0127 family)
VGSEETLEVRRTDGTCVWTVGVARSWLARLRGLIGRRGLAEGEGLYLPGTNGIHMLFMRFPIDCLFLSARRPDGTRQVLGVRERLAPWRGVVWWIGGAKGVLELPAGSVAASGIRRGDLINLTPAQG